MGRASQMYRCGDMNACSLTPNAITSVGDDKLRFHQAYNDVRDDATKISSCTCCKTAVAWPPLMAAKLTIGGSYDANRAKASGDEIKRISYEKLLSVL